MVLRAPIWASRAVNLGHICPRSCDTEGQNLAIIVTAMRRFYGVNRSAQALAGSPCFVEDMRSVIRTLLVSVLGLRFCTYCVYTVYGDTLSVCDVINVI